LSSFDEEEEVVEEERVEETGEQVEENLHEAIDEEDNKILEESTGNDLLAAEFSYEEEDSDLEDIVQKGAQVMGETLEESVEPVDDEKEMVEDLSDSEEGKDVVIVQPIALETESHDAIVEENEFQNFQEVEPVFVREDEEENVVDLDDSWAHQFAKLFGGH